MGKLNHIELAMAFEHGAAERTHVAEDDSQAPVRRKASRRLNAASAPGVEADNNETVDRPVAVVASRTTHESRKEEKAIKNLYLTEAATFARAAFRDRSKVTQAQAALANALYVADKKQATRIHSLARGLGVQLNENEMALGQQG